MKMHGRKKYPLQIAISTVFVTITLIIGGILSLQNYQKISQIILSSADQLYSQIARELTLDFRATYAPMGSTLLLFRQASIIHSTTLEERLKSLVFFKFVLQSNTSIY